MWNSDEYRKGREMFAIYKNLSAFYKDLLAFLQKSLGLFENNKDLSAFH